MLISVRLSPRGAPGRLLAAWLAGRFELIVSPALLAELAGVLERPKFRRWLTVEEARAFVQKLLTSATLVDDPPQQQHHGLRDPDDSYLLTLARGAKADCIVSAEPSPAQIVPRSPFSH